MLPCRRGAWRGTGRGPARRRRSRRGSRSGSRFLLWCAFLRGGFLFRGLFRRRRLRLLGGLLRRLLGLLRRFLGGLLRRSFLRRYNFFLFSLLGFFLFVFSYCGLLVVSDLCLLV